MTGHVTGTGMAAVGAVKKTIANFQPGVNDPDPYLTSPMQ